MPLYLGFLLDLQEFVVAIYFHFRVTMNVTQVKEVCLYVDDLYKAECFYHDLLQFPVISKVLGRHIFFVWVQQFFCALFLMLLSKKTRCPHIGLMVNSILRLRLMIIPLVKWSWYPQELGLHILKTGQIIRKAPILMTPLVTCWR